MVDEIYRVTVTVERVERVIRPGGFGDRYDLRRVGNPCAATHLIEGTELNSSDAIRREVVDVAGGIAHAAMFRIQAKAEAQ